jgi:hypothetical protein
MRLEKNITIGRLLIQKTFIMTKKNQHYVPQFYLRFFGVNSKFIHLYNVRKKLYIPKATIKHQCYKRKFYGSDGIIENELALMEQTYSQIIRGVLREGNSITQYPTSKDIDTINLLQFTFADESLYFDDNVSLETVFTLAKKSVRFRKGKRQVTDIFDEVGRAQESSLLVTKILLPDLKMNLSFLKIKRSAQKIPYKNRIKNRYRKEMPNLNNELPFKGQLIFKPRKKRT